MKHVNPSTPLACNPIPAPCSDSQVLESITHTLKQAIPDKFEKNLKLNNHT